MPLKLFKRFVKSIPDDPAILHKAQPATEILTSSLVISPLLVFVTILTGADKYFILSSILAIVFVPSITYFLIYWGYPSPANLFLIIISWIFVTGTIFFTGGISSPGITAYMIIILCAQLLLGSSAGMFISFVSIMSACLLFFLQSLELIPISLIKYQLSSHLVIQIFLFAWISYIVYLINRVYRTNLEIAALKENQVNQANHELQTINVSIEDNLNNIERRFTQLQVATDVARVAAALGPVDGLLNNSINLITERFNFYHAGIYMLDERGEYAILRAMSGEAGQQMLSDHRKLKIGDVGIVSYVIGTGQPRIALDVGADAIYFKTPYLPDTRSEMALPLKTGNKVIGAVDVQSKEPAAFDKDDIIILQTLADQLAVAIENARLFEATQRQIEELTILHTVSTASAEATSHDALIERATQLIGETLYPDHFGILLVDETAGVLRFHPSYRGLSKDLRDLSIPLGRGISGRVAITGRPIRVSDVTFEREYINIKSQMRCELCVPLKIGERIIGVINAESSNRNYFTDADERLLSTFAGQLATAIEKIRLFEVERRRVIELDALRQASLHMTSNLDLKSVLEAILEHALELVPADNAVIYLFDGENLTYGTALGLMTANHPLPVPRPLGLTNRVAASGKRIIVQDASNHPIYQDSPWKGAIAGLPLRHSDKVIGVMNLAFQGHPHEFDENELRLLELFADQAAVGLVNAQRYAEEQRRSEELAIALAEREELVILKNEFIQNVSHELRTPLTIVRGYVELLDKGELGGLSSDQQRAMSIITRRIAMLHRMIEDLTTILESETRSVQFKPLDLIDLLKKTIDDFKDTTHQAGVELKLELPPEHISISGDPIHLARLLDNLIGNAVKFTPSGGTIIIKLKHDEYWAILEVSDTGVGIPEDKLGRIFDRFYQVDGSTTRRFSGTGLGLALVKEIALSHGGQVNVASTLGQGSVFTIKFPKLEI